MLPKKEAKTSTLQHLLLPLKREGETPNSPKRKEIFFYQKRKAIAERRGGGTMWLASLYYEKRKNLFEDKK